jgi:TM2 domain-containing membrane protein YozV
MQIVMVQPKDAVTAYLLWFFLGPLGAHRFYLGHTALGVLFLCTGGCCLVGWLLDAFFLGFSVDAHNAEVQRQIEAARQQAQQDQLALIQAVQASRWTR